MAVKSLIFTILLVVLTSCAVYKTAQSIKIALLAPFEGQYREIGYDALYAARLAISERDISGVDLLAIDDGGSIATATLRVEAISQDPSIMAVIVLGPYATSTEAQLALDSIPMLIVGHWNTSPINQSVYMLTNSDIDSMIDFDGEITEIASISVTIQGSEILALQQVPLLFDNTSQLTIFSSSSLADAAFRERYLNSAEFAPEPSLLAPLTYDATHIVLQSIQTNTPIADIRYEGINGQIRFQDGYWLGAPINVYQYEGTELIQAN